MVQSVPEISNLDFKNNFYKKNKPLLILNGARSWPALQKWSFEYLNEVVGDIPIVLNLFEHFPHEMRRTILPKMTMKQAIQLMENNKEPTHTYYILRDPIINSSPTLWKDLEKPSWVEDVFFSTDLWFGSENNITPIHFDAVDNFLVQIMGEKKVILYDHLETILIYPHSLHTGGRFNFSEISSRKFLSKDGRFPEFYKATTYEVDLKPGNVLYIPPGWWHEVHTYEKPAASITFFFNKREFSSFSWRFLGYQSCRLHEIMEEETRSIIYFSNYTTSFDNISKLLEKKQYWLAIVLLGTLLENLVRIWVQNPIIGFFDTLKNSEEPNCQKLISHPKWQYWLSIFKLAHQEDNQKLSQLDLNPFVTDILNYIRAEIN